MAIRTTRQCAEVLARGVGKARVTRQVVHLLASGVGKAWVTRQIVEVLGSAEAQRSVVDSLGLAHAAGASVESGGTVHEASATDALSLTPTADAHIGYLRAVGDSLGLLQETEEQFAIAKAVEHPLGLNEAATGEVIHGGSDDLGLSDVATVAVDWHRSVSQPLSIVDTLDWRGPIYVAVRHVVALGEPAVGHLGTVNLSIHDTMALLGRAGRVVPASAGSTLALADAGVRRKTGVAQDVLAFVQTVSAGKWKVAANDLAFVDAVNLEAILPRSVTEDLGLVHSGTYRLVGSPCLVRQYHPFVGFSTDTEINPPDVLAPVLADATLTLTYPFTAPTRTVVLRNPEFGNKDSLTFNRVNRQTRGGTLVVYADPSWPKTQTLHVEVRWLKPPQVADLLAFFGQSLGKEVGLVDHENRQWRGIITDPDAPVANPARGDFMVSFEFEGQLC